MYSTIVYTATLFTLEGISRYGHMKLQTKRLEQKFDQTKTFQRLLPFLILYSVSTSETGLPVDKS